MSLVKTEFRQRIQEFYIAPWKISIIEQFNLDDLFSVR